MKTRLDFVFVELLHDAISSRIELLEIILRPPHYQVSVRVELRARVVEAMRHFVTNDGADPAIVERVVNNTNHSFAQRMEITPFERLSCLIDKLIRGLLTAFYCGRAALESLTLELLDFVGQHGQDFEQIADDAVIGNIEDRCFRIFVDSDNRLRVL